MFTKFQIIKGGLFLIIFIIIESILKLLILLLSFGVFLLLKSEIETGIGSLLENSTSHIKGSFKDSKL